MGLYACMRVVDGIKQIEVFSITSYHQLIRIHQLIRLINKLIPVGGYALLGADGKAIDF